MQDKVDFDHVGVSPTSLLSPSCRASLLAKAQERSRVRAAAGLQQEHGYSSRVTAGARLQQEHGYSSRVTAGAGLEKVRAASVSLSSLGLSSVTHHPGDWARCRKQVHY